MSSRELIDWFIGLVPRATAGIRMRTKREPRRRYPYAHTGTELYESIGEHDRRVSARLRGEV